MVMSRSMSDRFDQRQERKLDTKPGDVAVGPRLEIVTGLGRRREWPVSEKTRIIVESLTPGANVSEVARRNGLSPQQLFGWRREARELFAGDHGAAGTASAAGIVHPSPSATYGAATSKTRGFAPTFVPVVVAAGPSEVASPSNEADAATRTGVIEVAIGRNVVRVSGRVDADALQAVIDIVRRFACS